MSSTKRNLLLNLACSEMEEIKKILEDIEIEMSGMVMIADDELQFDFNDAVDAYYKLREMKTKLKAV